MLAAAAIGLTGWAGPACREETDRSPSAVPAARLLFGGDVMLGRGVAEVARSAPGVLFAGIRFQLTSVDVAIANLESPLTTRPHDPTTGPNALEARPASARLLQEAGFDAMGIANNHAGDAGSGTVSDTTRALSAAGIVAVGAGRSAGPSSPASSRPAASASRSWPSTRPGRGRAPVAVRPA